LCCHLKIELFYFRQLIETWTYLHFTLQYFPKNRAILAKKLGAEKKYVYSLPISLSLPGINACNLIKLKPQAKISEINISCIISGKYINPKNKAEGIWGAVQ